MHYNFQAPFGRVLVRLLPNRNDMYYFSYGAELEKHFGIECLVNFFSNRPVYNLLLCSIEYT